MLWFRLGTRWKRAPGEAERTSRTSNYKFWKDGFHPIMLDKTILIEQKLEYIHQNPVLEGFVRNAEEWKNSSALAYSLDDEKCCSFELEFLWWLNRTASALM